MNSLLPDHPAADVDVVQDAVVSWQVRRADGSPNATWETCTKEFYDATLRTGRYAGYETGPKSEVRDLVPAELLREHVHLVAELRAQLNRLMDLAAFIDPNAPIMGWLRQERGEFEGPQTLDPLFLVGPLPPEPQHGATYTPLTVAAGWQPMETAPKNVVARDGNNYYGPSILLDLGYGEPVRGRWWQHMDGANNFLADGGRACFPKKWMALPARNGVEPVVQPNVLPDDGDFFRVLHSNLEHDGCAWWLPEVAVNEGSSSEDRPTMDALRAAIAKRFEMVAG